MLQQVRWAAQSTRTEPSAGRGVTQEESSPWKTGLVHCTPGPLAGVNLTPHFPRLNIIKYSLMMGQDNRTARAAPPVKKSSTLAALLSYK